MKANYPCDMHCHTTRSDGNDTPLELIDLAATLSMHAIAITDHDIDPPGTVTLADGSEVGALGYAASKGIVLIPGYEFSTDTQVDDVHICGYGMDWEHPDLLAEIEAAKRSKSDGYKALSERLGHFGMPMSWEDDILVYSDAEGKRSRRSSDEVQRKHIFEAMAAKGYAESWSAAKITVRDNPELNVKRRKIDPLEAIQLIHRCGGIAVLAHPYLIDETVEIPGQAIQSRREYVDRLVAAGLDGIETRYAYDKTSYKGTMTPEEIEAEVAERYRDRVAFLSGGSDYHADHKKGAKNPRVLGERGLSVEEFTSAYGKLAQEQE